MIKNYKYFVALMLPLFAACGSDDVQYHMEIPVDQMKIVASAEDIVLNPDDADKDALTFSWNLPADRGEGSTITSYFRMDLEGNLFETSIDLIELAPDQTSITFTTDDLNDFLLAWGISPNTKVRVEAEIIATVDNEQKFYKPETSTTSVLLTGYAAVSRPLYIVNPAKDASTDDEMTEVVLSKQYTWSGWVDKNVGVKFVYNKTTNSPAITKGENNNTIVNTEGTGGELFTVDKSGYYRIAINKKTSSISWQYLDPKYQNLWMVGNAAPCGWDIANPYPMEVSSKSPWIFTYDGILLCGELKMPLATGSWGVDYLMPVVHYTDQNGDDNVQFIPSGNPDYKWNITEEGNYHVEVNTFTMKIKYEKK